MRNLIIAGLIIILSPLLGFGQLAGTMEDLPVKEYSVITDKIFIPAEKEISRKIQERVKNEYGQDKEIFENRIQDKTYTETAILQTMEVIAEDEIQKQVEVNLEKIKPIELELVKLNIVDISSPIKSRTFDSIKLREKLRNRDYSGVKALLSEWSVDGEISNAVVKGLLPKPEPFWVDVVIGRNAYFITDREMAISGDVVIVDVSVMENRLKYAEFIARNKDKRYAMMLGYGTMNNFDMPDPKDFPIMAKEFQDFYLLAKSIDENVVVGLTVCYRSDNWKEWVKAIPFNPDVLFVWNIYKTKANFKKVAQIFKGYDIIIAGMNILLTEGNVPNPPEYLKKLREANIKGSIWHK